jgi:hypothetical protein
MTAPPFPQASPAPDPALVVDILGGFLARRLRPEAKAWFDAELDRQRADVDEKRLTVALGLAGRKIGRADLSLSDSDIAAAHALHRGWQPQLWGTDEAGRTAILLATYRGDDRAFGARVDRLCANADVAELVACLKGFAIFPAPQEIYQRAREGVRSSIGPVFEAIACHNPYPLDHFEPAAWNQMVVKCVFTGASIETICGLRERRNPEVVDMLQALLEERRLAGRTSPEAVHRYIAGTL